LNPLHKRPKLIATDLDGTIVAHYGTISPRTVEAFHRAHEMGVEIFFVTGRPPRWTDELREHFTFGHGILSNGAMYYDIFNKKVLEEWFIPVESQLDVASRLRKSIPDISFAIDTTSKFHRESKYAPKWDIGVDDSPYKMIEDAMVQPCAKILARSSEEKFTSDEMLEIAEKELEGLVTVTHSNSYDSLLEISALGVSKGETLAKLAGRLGISAEESISFGDNPNDFSMLKWAGRSWAMADGHPDAKRHANFIAAPHQEDGVAVEIEKLLELPE
jgi:Cof subfamily protein (haloacid dehalogenase superfamily)